MDPRYTLLAARALTDGSDRLLTADEPIADLQENCGGLIPGTLAVPELLELVRQGRELGLKIARDFTAFDGVELVSGFARIAPLDAEQGGGCEVLIENWQRLPFDPGSGHDAAARVDAIDRAAAEVTARLDANQRVQMVSAHSSDTEEFEELVRNQPGQLWTSYVTPRGVAHEQPLHWRLLDGIECEIAGSARSWRARIFPMGPASGSPRGFELLLIADEPAGSIQDDVEEETPHTRLIGSALTPVLRQPIARIIANAETIRAKLAGPIRGEYSDYAGNIAAAGQHLSGMLDDLADLEVVEAPGFSTIREKVDLGDAAKRAAGILGVRAQARSIVLELSGEGEKVIAAGEFRRVLQILINLIGNAIAYSPEGSTVSISVSPVYAGMVSVSVADEGPGVSEEQAARIFDKFERLGRDSNGGTDTGSGLGLYISRKLARAMDGELTLAANVSDSIGAEFTLNLPVAD